MNFVVSNMENITRTFSTLDEAEKFQNDLYEKYDSVQLVRSPRFSEEGIYVWEVSGPILS